MKKTLSLFLIIILATGLVGCGNSVKDEAVEQGELALANKEYDKASSSFELALDEDSNDAEVIEMYDIVRKYNESKKYLDEKDIENAEKTLSDISNKYTKYAIEDDIDELKVKLENTKKFIKEEEKEEEKKASEEKEKKTSESVEQESQYIKVSRKSEYLKKFNEVESKENEIYDNTETGKGLETFEKTASLWDDFLNEIWGVLKQELPENEMDKLTIEQRQWLKDRDDNLSSFDTMPTYMSYFRDVSKERCKELIEEYMD